MIFDRIFINNFECFYYCNINLPKKQQEKLDYFNYCNMNKSEKKQEKQEKTQIEKKFFLDIELFLDFSNAVKIGNIKKTVDYSSVLKLTQEVVSKEGHRLIENIANCVAQKILKKFFCVKKIRIKIKKPSVPTNFCLESVSIEIVREQEKKEAVLAIGSNLGDRFENINNAIEILKKSKDIQIQKISKFYETKPFKVPNSDEQSDYINCCIKIKTKLSPYLLL